mgnify:FL=1
MCNPLAVGIAMGGAQAISGIQEQNRAHRAQVDAVNRSNAMARQKYLNDIQISAYNDQRKLDVFDAQLAADTASQQAFYKQKEINQIEANRALAAAEQELSEKLTEQMFASQANLAKAIQAQGTVLAGSMASGQSMLLELTQAERELGFEQAQIDATIFDATRSYGIDRYGIDLDQYAADTSARNSITQSALVAPTASFQTIKPIKQNAPKKPSILGPILGGITTTVGMGTAIGGEGYWASKPWTGG